MPRITPITAREQVAPEHRPVFDASRKAAEAYAGPSAS